jgi:predicted MFS family arabinose efflux permease
VLLVLWERRAASPFLDVRGFVAAPALAVVLGQQVAVQVVFYAIFLSLPLWLQEARHLPVQTTGLLMLPIAALGVVVTPVAARLVSRVGARPPLVVGSLGLVAGSLLLLTLGDTGPLAAIVAVGTALGLPNGFNNMGLQAALYTAAPPAQTGTAAGLFQTARYVGAILSAALLGLVLEPQATTTGLHLVALATTALALAITAASIAVHPRPSAGNGAG